MTGKIDHGSMLDFDEESPVIDPINDISFLGTSFRSQRPAPLTLYGYMFDRLTSNPGAHLSATNPDQVVADLIKLGQTMLDTEETFLDSSIPSAYTYFAQFVDHDLSLSAVSNRSRDLADPCTITRAGSMPLAPRVVTSKFKNKRVGFLQLDNIYQAPAPRFGKFMELGEVAASDFPIATTDRFFDLPRERVASNSAPDRAAIIGDPRNDQTLILSQLHVAFLRAHNAIIQTGKSFDEARTLLQQHYHWLIIHDFLPRVLTPDVLNSVLSQTITPFYKPVPDQFYLPLEFTVGAFRWGHCLSRRKYYYNRTYPHSSLKALFTYNALEWYPTLPAKKVIQWEHFLALDSFRNMARAPNPSMVEPLFDVQNNFGKPMPCQRSLAIMDLLRGYSWSIPSGQSIATELGYKVLGTVEIESVATSKEQRQVLQASGFSSCTPLWFYILAEARWHQLNQPPPDPNNPDYVGYLGPVGSRLIAEVLVELIRRSPNSILANPEWEPRYGNAGTFTLSDLFCLAGVL